MARSVLMNCEIESNNIDSGPVKTEFITDHVTEQDDGNPMKKVFEKGESIEFAGKVSCDWLIILTSDWLTQIILTSDWL